jgi:uncharacterized protein (DUF427 family)
MRARWNDLVLAQSDQTVVVEGNHYFPPASVRWDLLTPSDRTSRCFWKGQAHYWSVGSDPTTGTDVAWVYPEPLPAAEAIAGYIAFWNGVRVEDE